MKALIVAATLAVAGCGSSGPMDACSSNAVCAAGGTYKLCTSANATKAYYVTSDSTRFDCVTASDCAKATNDVTAWCQTH